jgi:hypothetical protein
MLGDDVATVGTLVTETVVGPGVPVVGVWVVSFVVGLRIASGLGEAVGPVTGGDDGSNVELVGLAVTTLGAKVFSHSKFAVTVNLSTPALRFSKLLVVVTLNPKESVPSGIWSPGTVNFTVCSLSGEDPKPRSVPSWTVWRSQVMPDSGSSPITGVVGLRLVAVSMSPK